MLPRGGDPPHFRAEIWSVAVIGKKYICDVSLCAVLASALLLSGCDTEAPSGTPLPALPVIQEGVTSLSPTVDGKRNDKVMGQICRLAQGQSSMAQIGLALKEEGILLADIPPQGHPLSMIHDKDNVNQVVACAAYLATSVYSPPNYGDLMVDHNLEEGNGDISNAQKIDPNKLRALIGARLAIARVNADVYSYIASELESISGLSLDEYRNASARYFSRLAPLYLRRVDAVYALGNGDTYRLLESTDSGFVFISASGFHYENSNGQFFLRYKSIPWLGGNYLMGNEYKINAAYFGVEWFEAGRGGEKEKSFVNLRDYKIIKSFASWLSGNGAE